MDLLEDIKTIENDILLAKRFNGQVDGWRRRQELCQLTINLIELRLNRLSEKLK